MNHYLSRVLNFIWDAKLDYKIPLNIKALFKKNRSSHKNKFFLYNKNQL